jgi:hypothetical protein
MKYFVFLFSILLVLGGCSGKNGESSPTTANGAGPAAANSNPAEANTVAATNSNPPAGMQPYNGMQNLDRNAFNATNDNRKVIKYEPKKDELPFGTRIAPDDSTMTTSSRGRDFVETRTFRSDPLLARVEKIMDGKTTHYKVYLKNGKMFEAPAEKMENMPALSPANILEAIGMRPNPPADPATTRDAKKDQKQ